MLHFKYISRELLFYYILLWKADFAPLGFCKVQYKQNLINYYYFLIRVSVLLSSSRFVVGGVSSLIRCQHLVL